MKTDQDKINEIDFHIKQKIIEAAHPLMRSGRELLNKPAVHSLLNRADHLVKQQLGKPAQQFVHGSRTAAIGFLENEHNSIEITNDGLCEKRIFQELTNMERYNLFTA